MLNKLIDKKEDIKSKIELELKSEQFDKTKFESLEKELDIVSYQIEKLEKIEKEKESEKEIKSFIKQETKMENKIIVNADRAADRPFRSYGEFVAADVRAKLGISQDARLDRIKSASGNGYTNTASDVASLFSPDYQKDFLHVGERTSVYNVLKSKGAITPTNKEIVNKNICTDAPFSTSTVGWKGQGVDANFAKQTYTPRQITLQTAVGLLALSNELIQDEPQFVTEINKTVEKDIDRVLSASILFGTGSGQPLGFFNGSTGGSYLTQAKVTNQTAATIVKSNITGMMSKVHWESIDDLVFFASPSAISYFWDLETSSNNNAVLFVPALAQKDGRIGTIAGIPVYKSLQLSALGTVNDIVLVNARGYLGFERSSGMQQTASVDYLFASGETALKFEMRFGGAPAFTSQFAANSVNYAMAANLAVRS